MQGFALAKRLHDDAVGRGAIMALAPGLAVPAAFQAAASCMAVRADRVRSFCAGTSCVLDRVTLESGRSTICTTCCGACCTPA